MIYHQKDGGVVRTQPADPNTFECGVCGTTWSEKRDVWQDSVSYNDVPNDVKAAADVSVVKALPPVRDPGLPRVGTVVEKAVQVDAIDEVVVTP